MEFLSDLSFGFLSDIASRHRLWLLDLVGCSRTSQIYFGFPRGMVVLLVFVLTRLRVIVTHMLLSTPLLLFCNVNFRMLVSLRWMPYGLCDADLG